MNLDNFLKSYGINNVEGHTGLSRKETEFLISITSRPEVNNIMEIGMNAGHSATNILGSNWNLNLTSFDLGTHGYVLIAKKFIDLMFPGRHSLIIGNSVVSVPIYANTSTQKFDLILIDGGHDKNCCYTDLINCKRLSHSNTLIILDDYVENDPKKHNTSVIQSWDELVAKGFIEEQGKEDFGDGHGVVYGKYTHME